MAKLTYKKIRKLLEKEQDNKRFEHTLGVASTAQMLASIYGADVDAAYMAGLLHDCAKCYTNKKRLSICEKKHIPVSDIEQRNPFLLHAKVGRYVASKEYEIDNEDILNAIENHTTGRPGMSLLEKIVFIADYIEPGRKHASNLPEIRRQAFLDLDKALLIILESTLSYLKASGNEIDEMTQKTYDYYKELMK